MSREIPNPFAEPADIRPKIHRLSDEALRNLAANAHRLEQEGTTTQRLQAHALIPAIDAELFLRRQAATAAAQLPKTAEKQRR